MLAANIAACALCLIFLGSAWHKWQHRADFLAALAAYRLLPSSLLPVAAHIIMIAEAVAALAVWLGGWGFLPVMALLALYSVAIAINLARGRLHMDCGCGGQPIHLSWHLLLRNGALLLLAIFGAAAAPGWHSASVALLSVLCGGIVLLFYLTANQLLANRSYWHSQQGIRP
ncbi:MAG: MauE/DoxX family redox-associated membrane protein [Cardiobacteriaceae bacterium]|nr:MauE/DoxX family redox-associated membrane protein [Cardiobacteriaceae bacterium]